MPEGSPKGASGKWAGRKPRLYILTEGAKQNEEKDMPEKVVRIGVIGVGTQGTRHIECFRQIPRAEVVAAADIDQARLKEVCARYEIKAAFTDYHQMVKEAEMDAVSIVLPDDMHLEPALAAIDAGLDLLVEKPLATKVEEAEAIVKAAREKGVRLMTNFSNRWQQPVALVKEAYVAGDLGKPVYVYARLSNTLMVPTEMIRPWVKRTSLPFWLMSHTVDRVRWIYGAEAKKVYGISRSGVLKSMGIDVEDIYLATVEWDNGAFSTFESSWILPTSLPANIDSKMMFIFTEGAAYFDAQAAMMEMASKERYRIPPMLSTSTRGRIQGFVIEALRHFVDSVAERKELGPSGEDGLAVCRITSAIVESAQKGKAIEL
ncbi:MAG: hypothetical protein AMS15_02145 [Planctomycetes bacterium DG_23]|nr:MAG: hypothetical protein AMS15_02145 [Planctomycetes bacterium DG_23]